MLVFRSELIPMALLLGGVALTGCSAGAEPLARGGSGPTTGGSGGPITGGSGGTSSTGGSGGTGATGEGGSSGSSPTGGSGATGGTTGGSGSAGRGGTGGSGGAGTTGGGGPSGTGGSGGTGLPPASISLPYLEDFEDGMANGWQAGVDDELAPLGTWAVVDDGGGKVYQAQQATSDPSFAVGGDYRWVDQHLEVRFKIVSGAEDALLMFVVRFSNFNSYYFLELRNDAMKIRVRNAGSTTDVTSYKFPAELVDGTWYTVGISAKGSTLGLHYNSMQVATATNAAVAAGGIGLAARDAVVAFDDVRVTAP